MNPDCIAGTLISYWNQTSLTPTYLDVIRTGPSGASSPYATPGTYAYDCGSTGVGNRKYFIILGYYGIIDSVGTC